MFGDVISESGMMNFFPVYLLISTKSSSPNDVFRNPTEHKGSVSIAFNPSLTKLYTFGSSTRSKVIFVGGGLGRKQPQSIYQFDEETKYSLYVAFIPYEEMAKFSFILDNLAYGRSNRSERYNFLKLLFDISIPRRLTETYFNTPLIHHTINISDQSNYYLKDHEDVKYTRMYYVTKGFAHEFDEKLIEPRVKYLMNMSKRL